ARDLLTWARLGLADVVHAELLGRRDPVPAIVVGDDLIQRAERIALFPSRPGGRRLDETEAERVRDAMWTVLAQSRGQHDRRCILTSLGPGAVLSEVFGAEPDDVPVVAFEELRSLAAYEPIGTVSLAPVPHL